MKKEKNNGGHARAKSLSPERRKAIAVEAATKRWSKPDAKAKKKPVQQRSAEKPVYVPPAPLHGLRDDLAAAVLTGLYANIDVAQKFAAHVMGAEMLLPEAFTRIAYSQADEALRLRSL